MVACVLLTLLSTMPLAAQQDTVLAPPATGGFEQPFWGAMIGSTVGVVGGVLVGLRLDDCERRQTYSPDDYCEFGSAFAGAAAGTAIGAAVGAYVGGKMSGGEPSAVASAVGSLLGIGAGALTAIGTGYLFGETGLAGPVGGIAFVVTHAGVTALFTSRSMQTPEEWR